MTAKTKKPSAFMKPVHVSDELAAIVGHGPLPRTEVTTVSYTHLTLPTIA